MIVRVLLVLSIQQYNGTFLTHDILCPTIYMKTCLFLLHRVLPLHDSAEIFTIKMAAWHNEVAAVRSWYQTEHDNWMAVAGDRSRWWVWNAVVEVAKRSVVQIQTYLQRISEGVLQCFS